MPDEDHEKLPTEPHVLAQADQEVAACSQLISEYVRRFRELEPRVGQMHAISMLGSELMGDDRFEHEAMTYTALLCTAISRLARVPDAKSE